MCKASRRITVYSGQCPAEAFLPPRLAAIHAQASHLPVPEIVTDRPGITESSIVIPPDAKHSTEP